MSSSRWPGSAARHSRTGTTTSPRICEVVLEEQVVVLADGAVDDVLDRDDAGRGPPGRDGLEDLAEAAERRPRDVAEGGDGPRPRRTRPARRRRRPASRRRGRHARGCTAIGRGAISDALRGGGRRRPGVAERVPRGGDLLDHRLELVPRSPSSAWAGVVVDRDRGRPAALEILLRRGQRIELGAGEGPGYRDQLRQCGLRSRRRRPCTRPVVAWRRACRAR